MKKSKKVLILGGGFGGLDTAIHLRKENYDVTLVSDRDYFYIFPTSIWVPTHDATFEDVSVDLKQLEAAHGFNLIVSKVTHIEAAKRQITLESGEVLSDYDILVVALGSGKMKHQGLENTLSICGAPTMSLDIRDRLDALIEKGSAKIAFGFGGNPKDASSVRGGPGFELLFNVHNMLKKKGIRENYELTMFAPMEKPGAKMGEHALSMMDKMFTKMNIHKHFGKKIKQFVEDGIVFEDDSKLDSDFTMFIPAGTGHELIVHSDLPLSPSGFVTINDYCQVEGLEDVYAVGDVAALQGPDWAAKQGHVAEVMAKNTAFNIIAEDKGLIERKGYIEHLNILCVMDSGDGAGFVYRDNKKAFMIPMPLIGHWLKKGWGSYCRHSKLGNIPRIPGM